MRGLKRPTADHDPLGFLAVPAMAKEAYLSDFVVYQHPGPPPCLLQGQQLFYPEMNNAIESGIETSFTFFIQLYEKRNLIWDKKIADLEVNHSIKYDSLKKIYTVEVFGKQQQGSPGKDLRGGQKAHGRDFSSKSPSHASVEKGKHYQLQMMAQLDRIRLPFTSITCCSSCPSGILKPTGTP